MRIGVPAETTAGETRVAVTPETAKKIIAQGHQVLIQSGAGVAASVTDAATLTATPVKVLTGGNAAWRTSGAAIETGDDRMTGAAEDLSYRALDRKENVEQAMLEYLKWEVELLDAVATDPDFGFKRFA